LSGAKPLSASARKRDSVKGEVTRYVGIFDVVFFFLRILRPYLG
jgi:hypothetical protein